MHKFIHWLVVPVVLGSMIAVGQEPELPVAGPAPRNVLLKSPLEEEPVIVQDRPLQEWFADLLIVAKTPEDRVKVQRAESVLKLSAQTEPMVCRLALWYDSRPKKPAHNHLAIRNAAGKLALPAIYEHLQDGTADRCDGWCLDKLQEFDDTSPEAIAALVSVIDGYVDETLLRRAAARLSEIGLPALEPLLQNRLAERNPSSWNSVAIEGIGLVAFDRVLEFSLQHPEGFLDGVLGRFCQQSPETVAPKLVAILQDPAHSACHRQALHSLAIAVEPKVALYKRIPVNLEGEHVVELAYPFLDDMSTRSDAAAVIAGWSPKPPAALDRLVKTFRGAKNRRAAGLIRAMACFPELPAETAEPLYELHKDLPGPSLEPWHRALSRLTPEGKAKIRDKMRMQAATSPRAAIGVTALDTSPATRQEMKALLEEMKKGQQRQTVEALLKWCPLPKDSPATHQ